MYLKNYHYFKLGIFLKLEKKMSPVEIVIFELILDQFLDDMLSYVTKLCIDVSISRLIRG